MFDRHVQWYDMRPNQPWEIINEDDSAYRASVYELLRTRRRMGKWAVAFMVVWPLLACTLWYLGSFSTFNFVCSLLGPIAILSMGYLNYITGQVPWWMLFTGTVVFCKRVSDYKEAGDWISERFDRSQVEFFSGHAFVFRHKRDAVMFKMIWG